MRFIHADTSYVHPTTKEADCAKFQFSDDGVFSRKLIYLGRLPQYSTTSRWREIRSYKNYVVIGSEASRHGVQIFDMTKVHYIVRDIYDL